MTARSPRHFSFVLDTVAPYSTGGREKRLDEIARRLVAAGHEVDVYTMKWWEGPTTIKVDGVSFHSIMHRRPIYQSERRSMMTSLLFGLACLRLLRRRLGHVDADQIPYFPVLALRLVCWIKGIDLTVTCCEVWGQEYWRGYLGRAGAIAACVERFTLRAADRVVSISERTTVQVRELCPGVDVHTVPLGVDFSRIRDAAPRASADVMFAGRLLEHKNVDELLRAIALVADRVPSVSCLIVGEGPMRSALDRLVTELGLSTRVQLVDFYEQAGQLYSTMKGASVLVLPSTREGFGLIALEANACGLPVITVRHPQNAAMDLIVDGVNGLVVERDPASLAGAIGDILSRPCMWDRAAIAAATARFDWNEVAQRVGDAVAGVEKQRNPISSIPARSSSAGRDPRLVGERQVN